MRELVAIYDEVVKALDARKLARDAASRVPRPGEGGKIFVLGLGKVASELFEGIRDALGPVHGTLVAPKDAPAPSGALVIHGDHPVPDRESLRAGESLLAAARSLRPEDTALILLSG